MLDYKKIFKSRRTRSKILRLLSFVPDKIMLKIQYRLKLGRKLHLSAPNRYTEKLQWYKLYYRNPLMKKCVNKYTELTRNYQSVQFELTESENIEGMGNTFNGHTYAVIPYEADLITAKELCETNGGHLVTITSQAEQDFVASLAANVDYEQFWLGGSDNDSEGEWYWMNGETWDYTAWNDGEPNNGLGSGQNYSAMGRGIGYLWDDAYSGYDNYTDSAYFICEWDSDVFNVEDGDEDDGYIVVYNANGGTFEDGQTVRNCAKINQSYKGEMV